MSVETNFQAVASALSQPSRAAMLQALMAGIALPASELAYQAGVSNATASTHLKMLVDLKLLRVIKSGRHRYFELADTQVSELIERFSLVAPTKITPWRHSAPADLRCARICYDHLAGRLGVAITDALIHKEAIIRQDDNFVLTEYGSETLAAIGVNGADHDPKSRRAFARVCVDWSERRPHIAGHLGAKIASSIFALGWIERNPDNRALSVTPGGLIGLRDWLGIDLSREPSTG